nr:MAG TPA: resistance protein [Caudoviricetes sp.]
MTLYELNQSWQEVFDMLLDADVPEEAIFDTIEGIEASMDEKADSYAKIIRSLEGDAGKLDAEIKRLQARKAGIQKRREWLMQQLTDTMRSTGRLKFRTALFSFAIQKNGGARPVDVISEVPKEWLKPGDPDTKRIREWLEAGNTLPFAVLGNRGESLRIR